MAGTTTAMATALPSPGVVVPHHYFPGFIVLCYCVSALGCWTALELLHRRTSRGGLSNWFLLAAAATVMGTVAMWAMHSIGMASIIMGGGEINVQLNYSPVYTAGSFLLPIVVLAIAFFILSAAEKVNAINLIVGGCIAGAAICGMHYVGVLGIKNYIPLFDYRFIIASVLIGVGAASTVLGVFFRFKYTWTNAVWKRAGCALALACAISLTHWIATLGTNYQWRGMDADDSCITSGVAVIVSAALSFVCLLILASFACCWQRVRRLYANRAQQVVVATATFDPEGRILLNSGGLLPCQKVTNAYIERSFKDDFTVDHPVYSWIFRASRNWLSVRDLVPSMRRNLTMDNMAHMDLTGASRGDSAEMTEDYAVIFKQLFCVAVQDLTLSLQDNLENAGILYDRILDTGTVTSKMKMFRPLTPSASDLESGRTSHLSTLGRGQLLFLVRHVGKADAWRLQAGGFKFAPVPTVADHLAQSMQITTQELLPHLEELRRYREAPRPMEPGVHVACFMLRPVVGRGFEVLADARARNLLPAVRLPLERLEPWQEELLQACDGFEVSKLLRHWNASSQSSRPGSLSERSTFISTLLAALNELAERIGPDLFRGARLTAKPLAGPVGIPFVSSAAGSNATVLALRLVCDIHRALPPFPRDEFVPCRLFLAQQYAYPGSPDHAAFAARVYQEFASLEPPPAELPASPRDRSLYPASMRSNRLSCVYSGHHRLSAVRDTLSRHGRPRLLGGGTRYMLDSADSLAEKGLARGRVVPLDSVAVSPGPLGGVQVSKEVHVVTETTRTDSLVGEEKEGEPAMGVRTEVGTARERESMMDELMGLALGTLSPSQP